MRSKTPQRSWHILFSYNYRDDYTALDLFGAVGTLDENHRAITRARCSSNESTIRFIIRELHELANRYCDRQKRPSCPRTVQCFRDGLDLLASSHLVEKVQFHMGVLEIEKVEGGSHKSYCLRATHPLKVSRNGSSPKRRDWNFKKKSFVFFFTFFL